MKTKGLGVAVLSFHGGRLVGGGRVYRMVTPGGACFWIAVARGRTPDLDGALEDPTVTGIERTLRRNERLQWCRVDPDGTTTWHPTSSSNRVELKDGTAVVCYGIREAPGWLRDLAIEARAEIVLRMAAASGLDVAAGTFTEETLLEARVPVERPADSLLDVSSLVSWASENRRSVSLAVVVGVVLAVIGFTTLGSPTAGLRGLPMMEQGVGLEGSGLPPLELDPCAVLRESGRVATATFCQRVVSEGRVEPDLWYLTGTTCREVRADLQSLSVRGDRQRLEVFQAWAPVLSALFGKLLLVDYMPPTWGVDVTQADSPFLGPTRPFGDDAVDFTERFAEQLASSPAWRALWRDVSAGPPDAVELQREIFGRSRVIAAHGELSEGARR